jgi:hypothetical protein
MDMERLLFCGVVALDERRLCERRFHDLAHDIG